jgi:hypothetical protein
MLKPSKMFRCASRLIALLVLVCGSQIAIAGPTVFYTPPDFVGPNIMYLDVKETPNSLPEPDPLQLFGPPTLSGDTLFFNPTDFSAGATGGSTDFVDSFLVATVMTTNASKFISDLWVTESGSYTLSGGTAAGTRVTVSMDTIKAVVLERNGVPVAPFELPRTITYTNLGSAVSTTAFGGMRISSNGIDDFIGQGWKAEATFNLAGVTDATKIILTVDNTLFARSELGSTAFIDKKDFYINNTVVPEPGTIVLGLMGGLGMLVVGRKAWKKQEVA